MYYSLFFHQAMIENKHFTFIILFCIDLNMIHLNEQFL